MLDVSIDKRTYKILEFIYDKEHCTVKELCDFLQINDLQNMIHVTAPLIRLFEPLYICIINPKLNIYDSSSFDTYKSACTNQSLPLFSKDCIVAIAPNGSVYVESKREEHESLRRQIEPLEKISASLQNQVNRAEKDAATADRDARFSKAVSIIAIIASIAAIIVPQVF